MDMVRRGEVSLDDPVAKNRPGFAGAAPRGDAQSGAGGMSGIRR